MSLDSAQGVELVREAIRLMLLLAAPLLAVLMVTGLVVGVAQALTQVQDQTLNVVPRLVAAGIAVLLFLPWMATRMVEYTSELIRSVAQR
jgi:flagellar biosynthetic protein FliQ